MTKRDFLEAGIRLIGVWQLASSVEAFVTYRNVYAQVFSPSASSANAFLAHGLSLAFVGLALFVFAPNLVNLVDKSTTER